MKKTLTLILTFLFFGAILSSYKIMSNPNCPTGYTTAPGLNSTTTRNCTSCHGGASLNTAGGGITATGLPTTYTAGQSYPFSIKITHSASNRVVWGVAIKAIDTLTHAVIGTWTTTNTNTSIKGTAGGSSYELSHANAATSTATNIYTYSNLTWVAPSAPTAVQARVKFYISAVAGNGSGDETGDYVYATSLTANQFVAPTPCTFTYGAWTTCSNGTQTRTYTASPAGCTGTPPADSITRTCSVPCTFTYGAWTTCSNGTQTRTYTTSPAGCTGTPPADSVTRTCTVPTGLPTPVTITASITPNTCDTVRTFTVPNQNGVFYAWVIGGTGNRIVSGQGTNSITAIVKIGGSVTVSLSNSTGSIPATSLAFTIALPPTPTAIGGTLSPCPNSTVLYTLTNPVPTATQAVPSVFRWTIPTNTTIISANADSTQISLQFSSLFNGGTLAAKAQTACGIQSAAKSIVLSPAKATDYISSTGFLNFCIGSSANFIVVSPVGTLATGVSVYRWTIPAFTSITSANSDSSVITLQFNTGYKGGALAVRSSTTCGALGTAVSKTLTHLNCAAGQRAGIEVLTIDQVNVYPNPNDGNFTINIETSIKTSSTVQIEMYDVQGKLVGTYTATNNNGLINKSISNTNIKNGVYILKYRIGNNYRFLRVVIQK